MKERQEHKEQGVNLKVEYEIEVRDKNDKIIEDRKEKSESLVKNFLMLQNACFKIGTSICVDTSNTSQAAGAKTNYSPWDATHTVYTWAGWTPTAPEADDTYGIIVGTSDQVVAAGDYNLISKISHGDAGGLLHYYATTLLEPTVDGNTVRQRFERSFKNNSDVNITVREIGLVLKTSVDNYLIMIIRDIVTLVTVPLGGKMRVIYTIITG